MKVPPEPQCNSLSPKFIEDVTKDIMSKFPSKTEEEFLVEKANILTKEVIDTFLKKHQLRITPMKLKDAANELRKMYREHYHSWTQEELIELAALKDGIGTAQRLRDELI